MWFEIVSSIVGAPNDQRAFSRMHKMKTDGQDESDRNQAGQFATTHWSLVLEAGNGANEGSHRALEKLCRAYWPPLYAYVRRRVTDIHQAQDLTQAFFERLLDKRYLADAAPDRGRFRSFLITAFQHFLSKEWDKAKTRKRGGSHSIFSVDFTSQDSRWSEPADNLTAERIYERQWAETLLGLVMSRLQREMERSGKGAHFQYLKEVIGRSSHTSYASIATALEIRESTARMAASRLRRRYRELLREEIAKTVASDEDIDSEVQDLFAAFTN